MTQELKTQRVLLTISPNSPKGEMMPRGTGIKVGPDKLAAVDDRPWKLHADYRRTTRF